MKLIEPICIFATIFTKMNPKSNLAATFFIIIALVYDVSAAYVVRKLATIESSEISEPPNLSPAPAPSGGLVDEKKCYSRCKDLRSLTGCLQFSPTAPEEAFLFVKNDGESPLKVNVTISHPKPILSVIEIPKQGTKKINISAIISERPSILLNAGNGECVIGWSVSNSNILKQILFYAAPRTLIYGAYLLLLTVLITGVTWACCKSRKSKRQGDGVPYQDLEMAKPESLAASHVETVEAWDQGWGNKWDDEIKAENSLSEDEMENGSANGLTLMSPVKGGWKNDWND